MDTCTEERDEIEYEYDAHATLYLYSLYEQCRELNDSPLEYNALFHRVLRDMLENESE